MFVDAEEHGLVRERYFDVMCIEDPLDGRVIGAPGSRRRPVRNGASGADRDGAVAKGDDAEPFQVADEQLLVDRRLSHQPGDFAQHLGDGLGGRIGVGHAATRTLG